jgi:23S rRNA-/tRNA-specific pseudouridylate synthase
VPEELPPILLEDDAILAVDRPAGLGVSALLRMVRDRFGDGAAYIHRFDPESSGIALLARGKEALDFVGGQFQSKHARLVHHALVSSPQALAPSFTVDSWIGPDGEDASRMRTHKRGGEPALTEFRVAEAFGRFAWVECLPATTRRHQIRVHLAEAGAPVIGDGIYGDPSAVLLLSGLKKRYKGREEEKPLVRRLALHGSSATFLHPRTREPVTVTAPLPRDLEVALKYLRRFGAA